MASTLKKGSKGTSVKTLQTLLNSRPPSCLALLVVDGAFGSKTQARVIEFQQNYGLPTDGVVQEKTWNALNGSVPSIRESSCHCGTGDPANLEASHEIQTAFLVDWARKSPAGCLTYDASFLDVQVSQVSSLSSGSSLFRELTADQETAARRVFGNSLDFSKIRITNQTGLQDRPFTVAVGVPFSGYYQVMNLGTYTPPDDLLIHELAHVWQSQHHSTPTAFMVNAASSQAGALTSNTPFAIDSTVKNHRGWPTDFPFSAYAYEPGKPFNEYGAEQIAQQIEHGVSAIVSHVRSVSINTVDPLNVGSLMMPRVENRFNPLVRV